MMMLLAVLLTDANADCSVAAGQGTAVTLDVQLHSLDAEGALSPGGQGYLSLYRVRGGVYDALGRCEFQSDGGVRVQLSYEGGGVEAVSVELDTGDARVARRYFLAPPPGLARSAADLILPSGSGVVPVAFAVPAGAGARASLEAACSAAEADAGRQVEERHAAALAALATSHEVLWSAVAGVGEVRADDAIGEAIAALEPAAQPMREASTHLDIDPDNTHITDALIAYGAARTLLEIALEGVDDAARLARKRKVPAALYPATDEVSAALQGVDLALDDAGDALELLKAWRDPALSLRHLPEEPALAAALTARAATCRVSVTQAR